MAEHTVFCVKLKQQLPGLPEPPFDSELGNKIYESVSQQAWGQWTEHCKMLLNEYRLNPARKQDQEVIVHQMEQFFFGEGADRPGIRAPGALSFCRRWVGRDDWKKWFLRSSAAEAAFRRMQLSQR